MPRRKKVAGPKPVEAVRHEDKRANIPTEELRSFVREDEERPPSLLYTRDPSLDPQLVWRGKDEQDAEELRVPVVPVYIQEKIQPQALIENLRETAGPGEAEPEQLLFADFNGLDDLDKKLEFYEHENRWTNRLILGDSLLVMASLSEKEGLKGRVQMVYIDPPYGIKFGSNWQVSTRRRDVKDGKVKDASREPEVVKAFRDTWELGIHSYLAYLRDRFQVARDLLTETGSIFVQIGDENVHLVRCVLDEVFGSENFASLITFTKSPGGLQATGRISSRADYLLWYAKSIEQMKYRPLFLAREDPQEEGFRHVELTDGRRLSVSELENADESLPEGARFFDTVLLTKPGPGAKYAVRFRGQKFTSGARWWGIPEESLERVIKSGRIVGRRKSLRSVRYFEEAGGKQLDNVWDGLAGAHGPVYVVQTNPKIIERCLLLTTDPGDLVLDPTCGSGTTSVVAEQWARRWIAVDTSRVAMALTRTRMMAAKYPYYVLRDSLEGATREARLSGTLPESGREETYGEDVRQGFVARRIPRVTLKAIANNEEIDEIWADFQEKLEPLREALNASLAKEWSEWEVPWEPDSAWPTEAKRIHHDYWEQRRKRQEKMDVSIAQRADHELLLDQPFELNDYVRVTGPFTVESLSPHRVLSTDDDRPESIRSADREAAADFVPMILENLQKAGVQNTRRAERLTFDRLEAFPGTWLQASGEYTDAAGEVRRVAVSVGPEYGTVGQKQVEEAAKEAMKGVGSDLLLVLGFSFDASAGEKAREISPEAMKPEDGFVAEAKLEYGRLPVLLVKMNPDLSMGDELLKKTGAGNLFMVFGEPDVEVSKDAEGRLVVSVRGVDVYDPTTGEVRSSSVDDIACWFIDSDYNGESFFVRHAYFTGAGDPYERLRKALRADIDRESWESLYRTTSRPFDRPSTGKIGVKVINHYGDEILKIYDV